MSQEARDTVEVDTEDLEEVDGEELVEAVTRVRATDDDVEAILAGDWEETQPVSLPERLEDGRTTYVRRSYEPVSTIRLEEPITSDEVTEWVDAHRDRPDFEGYDWDAHDRREFLDEIVATRGQWLDVLADVEREMADLRPASATTRERIDEVRRELTRTLESATPTLVEGRPLENDAGSTEE